jgi:hypothetical protein
VPGGTRWDVVAHERQHLAGLHQRPIICPSRWQFVQRRAAASASCAARRGARARRMRAGRSSRGRSGRAARCVPRSRMQSGRGRAATEQHAGQSTTRAAKRQPGFMRRSSTYAPPWLHHESARCQDTNR